MALKKKDDLEFGINARKVLQARYLLKNGKGEIIETPAGAELLDIKPMTGLRDVTMQLLLAP